MPSDRNSMRSHHCTLDETPFVTNDSLSEVIERRIALIAQVDVLCLHLQSIDPQRVLDGYFRLPICMDELYEIAADLGYMQHVWAPEA